LIKRLARGLQRRVKPATDLLRRAVRHARRSLTQLDEADIRTALQAFGPFTQSILCVHSSLSACGTIRGGPATVVKALREWIGENTLVMVTHTYCYPDETGAAPLYDPATTPSRVGAISDWFWRQPGVLRSLHPSHSIAAAGPLAEKLCAAHELTDTPCGPGTPYQRMIHEDASVLMFGARMDAYTLFHTAEDAAKVPYLYLPEQCTLKIKAPDGSIRTVLMWRQDWTVPRSFICKDTWLEQRGLLKRQKLGRAELLFIAHARAAHETIVAELRRDPLFLVADSARPELMRKFAPLKPVAETHASADAHAPGHSLNHP
jgi:aminoglycoside 3-N-acetyltransferase